MSNRLFLDDLDAAISYNEFTKRGANTYQREQMKKILTKALHNELTELQKKYLCDYYLKGYTMQEIAVKYNLNKSTVSRTVSRAKEKLRKIAAYYQI